MNALQSYSSDDNSDDDSQTNGQTMPCSKPGDHETNYDDVGMDISEESGDEVAAPPPHTPTNKDSGRSGRPSGHHSREPEEGVGEEDKRNGSSDERRDEKNRNAPSRRYDDRRNSREEKTSSPTHSSRDRHGRPSKSRRSRSPTHRRRSRSRDRRSRSRDRRSRSRDRRSRSRGDRRSRSRSRERRDRRRRSRSRDRRRGDHRRDFSSAKPGLLPLPTVASGHPPPLLATPPIPPLPSYYNPNSVSALKYAEQERKKKLLWGNKGGSDPSSSGNGSNTAPQIPGLLPNPPTPNPLALMGLNRSNPTGRELNLGLGKNQFSSTGGQKGLLPPKEEGNKTKQPGMTDLWSATTFSNDQDGKMAQKFKRLMGVKGSADTNDGGRSTSGENITEKQRDMFSNMEKQYEVARQATHTHKGFGLGFTSSSYLSK